MTWTREETAEHLAKMVLGYPSQNLADAGEEAWPTVSYYFKPQTKYPPRLQLLYDWWPERNKRASGISKQPCLYTRRVGLIEREEMNDCGRLMAGQFEAHQMNHMIWRLMDDGLSDSQIQTLLDAVLPYCTPEFRNHEPVAAIRAKFIPPPGAK